MVSCGSVTPEVTFTSLDVEEDYDFVHVYDGATSSSAQVAEISGARRALIHLISLFLHFSCVRNALYDQMPPMYLCEKMPHPRSARGPSDQAVPW